MSPANWDITGLWWDRCQTAFDFSFSLEMLPKLQLIRACVHTASLQLSAQRVLPQRCCWAGNWVSAGSLCSGKRGALHQSCPCVCLLAQGQLSCTSACSKHPSQVGTEVFLTKNALRGSLCRGQPLFGLDLGVSSRGAPCSEHSSCAEPCFILNFTKSAVVPEWLKIINNCNAFFMVFVRAGQEKHAGD